MLTAPLSTDIASSLMGNKVAARTVNYKRCTAMDPILQEAGEPALRRRYEHHCGAWHTASILRPSGSSTTAA